MSERDDYSLLISTIVRDVAMGKVVISPWIASRWLRRQRRFYDQFTRREMDLLRLLTDGYQVKEIANRPGVAKGTVYNTMSDVYGKLGVYGVTPAVLEVIRRDVITLQKTRLGTFPPALLYAIKLTANSEEREPVETQSSLFIV